MFELYIVILNCISIVAVFCCLSQVGVIVKESKDGERKPRRTVRSDMSRRTTSKFNLHSSCYKDIFLLRTPITVNNCQAEVKLFDDSILQVSSRTGVLLELSMTNFLQAVSYILYKHGVYHVESLYCEQSSLMFSIKFHSQSKLEQFLTDKNSLQKDLSATITDLCESEFAAKCDQQKSLQSSSMKMVSVDVDVFLVSPTTHSPQVVQVNLANYRSIWLMWQNSKMCSFDSSMFAYKNTVNQGGDEEAELADLQVELNDVLDWFQLGVQLKIPTHYLLAIRQDYRTTQDCRLEMLIRWDQLEKPTWRKLFSALVSIGRKGLADSLARKYGLPQPFDDMTIRDTACYEVAQTEQTLSAATNELTEAKQSQILTSQRMEQVTEEEIPLLQEKVKSLTNETEILKTQLEHRNKELGLFNKLLPSAKCSELELINGLVKDKSEQIKSLQDELDTKKKELNETRKQLGEKETELTEMRNELSAKLTQVQELEKEVERLKQSFHAQQEEMNKKLIEASAASEVCQVAADQKTTDSVHHKISGNKSLAPNMTNFKAPPEKEKPIIIDETTVPPTRDLRFVLKEKCDLIPHKSEGPLIYRLAGRETKINLPGLDLCRVSVGEPTQGVPEKVFILFGASGAGMSTLINAMVNYILGVEWKDDFRFKLITDEAKSQAHSQTSAITTYTIHHMEGSKVPYDITIIDTPGFGDTRGLKRDNQITRQVAMLFTNEGHNAISHLDGIGFVTQSAFARLTPTQQYIFDSILSIFGKDMANNIFMMVTFADGQMPPVMTAIETACIPHSGFFKFNNSALFAERGPIHSEEDEDGEEGNFNEMFWKMGMSSFKKFLKAFQKAQSVSLSMTKDVLQQRDRLQALTGGIQRRIQGCLSDMEVLRQERMLMQKHETAIAANKDFICYVDVPYYDTERLPPGMHVTTCLHCNINCHFPCPYSDNDDKKYCNAMRNGYCTICVNKCHWSVHKNTGERFIRNVRREASTSEDLKRRYNCAMSEKSALENMIDSHQHKLEGAHVELHETIDEARTCLMRLEEIALKPNPVTQVDCIQLLIDAERKQAREGWKDRVRYLETILKQTKLLAVLPDVDNIDQRITDLKMKQETGWEEMVEMLEQVKRINAKVDTIKQERQAKYNFR